MADGDGKTAGEWLGQQGARWEAHLETFEAKLAPISQAMAEHGVCSPGARVLDIGCGGGRTTIALARQVGSDGEVIGVDIAPGLIAIAQRRAREAGIDHCRFVVGDAQSVNLEPRSFDCLHSRMGTMFFADPLAAFSHIASLGRAGAQACFAVWTPPSESGWIAEVMAIIDTYREAPPPIGDTPGPFSLADPDRLFPLLSDAGFRAVSIDGWRGKQPIAQAGASPQEAADFVLKVMSLGRIEDDMPDEIKERIGSEVARLFSRHSGPSGVEMEASAWIVSAQC